MSIKTKIEALRRLAERPGTEAEGRLARERADALETKLRATSKPDQPLTALDVLNDYLNKLDRDYGSISCPCGVKRRHRVEVCPNQSGHKEIADLIARTFPPGTRVYYNRWAYTLNCPAVVLDRPAPEFWLWLKFDHLRTNRKVPIVSEKGFHLSTVPLELKAVIDRDLTEGYYKFWRTHE